MDNLRQLETVLVLLGVVLGLAPVARKLAVPYPSVLVIGGLVLAVIPGLPAVRLEPDLVFLVFLPPILWSSAYLMSAHSFRANFREIRDLAIGLVVATAAAVAVAAHALFPGMGWGVAWTLGAILSPTDAVAATTVAKRFRIPRRVVAILEGESLVNDATALVLYEEAVRAVVTGEHQWGHAIGMFVYASAVGVAIGIIVGVIGVRAVRLAGEGTIQIGVTLLCPYIAWVLATQAHGSAVLACVAGGLYVRPRLYTGVAPATRIQMNGVWRLLVDLLNGVIFILIGLQLASLRAALPGGLWSHLFDETAVIALTAIAVRFAYVFGSTDLAHLASKRPRPPASQQLLIAWTGMRGILSIAAALALPLVTDAGTSFPYRSEIILVVFGFVLLTLLGQGLLLAPIIRLLRFTSDAGESEDETTARGAAVSAALRQLDTRAGDPDPDGMVRRLRAEYSGRLSCLVAPGGEECVPAPTTADQQLRAALLRAERTETLRLHSQGKISDELLNRLDYELDVEAIRFGLGDDALDRLSGEKA